MRPAWTIASSLGLHVAGLAAAASIGTLAPSAAAPPIVPIDIVRVDPPPAAAAPPPPPKGVEKITPPRLAVRPQEVVIPTTAPAAPTPPAPLQEEPRPRPSAPAAENGGAPDAKLLGAASGAGESLPALAGAGRFGAGTGDLLLPAGDGGGAPASGPRASGPRVAGIPQETTDGGGLTDFARPLGGYQTKPSYPESARRQGIEGIATLRFQVLASGQVGSVSVAKSAGHTALDRAAVEAVKSWLFEPARRGKDAVSVWVTLPVRFQLQSE